MDHTNYARWDMLTLEEQHRTLYNAFMQGRLTVQKTDRLFSNIATDEAHEQENVKIKGDCSATRLFQDENPSIDR